MSDKPACRFFLKPDGCKNGDSCQYAHLRTNGNFRKCLRCGSESHNLQACARPRRQQSSPSDSVKPASKKTYAKPKGKAADTQGSYQGSQEKKKSKGKSKGKGSQTKPTAKSGDVDFDDNTQADQDDQDEVQAHDEPQEDDPEAYVIAAATSSSESDTWKEDIWQGLTVQPITHVNPQDQSFLTPVIEHVKSVEYLTPRKVSYPWTGETHFGVTPAACGNSVFRTAARILVPVSDMNPILQTVELHMLFYPRVLCSTPNPPSPSTSD